jgi:UDP-2,3-diacylglucosamine hydrolase
VSTPAVPPFQELVAPPEWRTAEFISDLHLQASDPATFDAWRAYMRKTTAGALFILGDLFEAWVGDDVALAPGFEADCAAVLRATATRLPVFVMHGNRDFLVGAGLMQSSGATLLEDPTVLSFLGRRWLLTHGDSLCLDDTEYLAFRAQVRTPAWQREFLARPLAERRPSPAACASKARRTSVPARLYGRRPHRRNRVAGGGGRQRDGAWPHAQARCSMSSEAAGAASS